ncbi:hypothetical protein AAC387_Pa09g0253 [Persea americana]
MGNGKEVNGSDSVTITHDEIYEYGEGRRQQIQSFKGGEFVKVIHSDLSKSSDELGEEERTYCRKGDTVTVNQRTMLMHQLHRTDQPCYTVGHAEPPKAERTTSSGARLREEGMIVVWGERRRAESDTVLWR